MIRLRGSAFAVCAFLTVGVAASPAGASNDPQFPQQWNLTRIGAPAAWASSTGRGVRVGIVDTGVDLKHEDLAGKVVAGTSCVGSGGDPAKCAGSPQDDHGHGTHVAGIIAAVKDNGIGIAGVAPDAQLVVAKALNEFGAGRVEDINAGIKWVVAHGAKVVNLSLGDPAFLFTSLYGTPIREGIEYAWSHGAVPVVAAGNTNFLGLGSSNYGALNAIIVGATDSDDRVTSYSSPVGNAKWAILAPGGADDHVPGHNVFSTYWEKDKINQYKELAGTSMATPHVAGALALLLAEGLSPGAAVTHLLETGDPKVKCGRPTCHGRLDLARAVRP